MANKFPTPGPSAYPTTAILIPDPSQPARTAHASVFAGSTPCALYNAHVDHENAYACWIAVEPGMPLSVNLTMGAHTDKWQVEIIVDGVVRFIKGNTHRTAKNWNSNDIFRTFYTVEGKKFVAEQLRTAPIKEDIPRIEAQELRQDKGVNQKLPVGVIEIRLSKADMGTSDTYEALYTKFEDVTEGVTDFRRAWPSAAVVAPDLQAAFPATEQRQELLPMAKTRAKQSMTGPRYGRRPWAIFKFYYRSQATIDRAGFTVTSTPILRLPPLSEQVLLDHPSVTTTNMGDAMEVDNHETYRVVDGGARIEATAQETKTPALARYNTPDDKKRTRVESNENLQGSAKRLQTTTAVLVKKQESGQVRALLLDKEAVLVQEVGDIDKEIEACNRKLEELQKRKEALRAAQQRLKEYPRNV